MSRWILADIITATEIASAQPRFGDALVSGWHSILSAVDLYRFEFSYFVN